MLKKESKDRVVDLLKSTQDERRKVRQLVEEGKRAEAEPDPERRLAYAARQDRLATRAGRESLQGPTDDLQPVAFLSEGSGVRRAVGKVEVNLGSSNDVGTGFMVSPDLFLTNQHVVRDHAAARVAVVVFDYEISEDGEPVATTTFRLDPARFAAFSPEEALDYALVALGQKVQGSAGPDDFGFCPISDTPDRHRVGMNVNLIQHPNGIPKSIAVRNNLLTHRTDRTLLYETDSLHGSSGAPVFNDDWDVVALHHYGTPSLERVDDQGVEIPRRVNEGIRISRVFQDLRAKLPGLVPEKRLLLEAALSAFEERERARADGLPRLAPRPLRSTPTPDRRGETDMDKNPAPDRKLPAAPGIGGPELRFTVPLEIVVRVGETRAAPAGGMLMASRQPLSGALPVLRPEGKKLDRDYTNRNGFDPAFVNGVEIDLAEIVAPVQGRVTPLNEGEADPVRGELKYQNFSVIMDSERRLARITATNIDGDTYKRVDRDSGEVVPEGESWYIERRIDRGAFIDQSFYDGWSHIFDRGHLTRRNDPTWGSDLEAQRANADTFHFTNCSPQQWRFNQNIEFWQGLERYVLERGVFQPGARNDLTVLQGPVFDDAQDLWADDVQIPSQFWKLVLWRGPDGPKAVALVASQADMLGEVRRFGGPRPDEDAAVDVEQYRVSVPALEVLTGLDFSAFRGFDTITDPDAPLVGAEAARARVRVRSWRDIRL
jgi:endonuclease G